MESAILTSLAISATALLVSIIALVYTIRAFLLKKGSLIRGTYSQASSIYCDDRYVSSVTIENLKDRAVSIFKILLKVGHNYYIEIEDFSEDPLILKPFEIYHKEYEPIDLYSVNQKRIYLNNLLSNNRVRKRLVLSTTEGKYVIKSGIKRWDPVLDFFQNHFTAAIQTRRSTYKGKAYGGNTKYIVDIKTTNGEEEVIALYSGDFRHRRFRGFKLTKDSMESRVQLVDFLETQKRKGNLDCDSIEVYDAENWYANAYEKEDSEAFEGEYVNWFMYTIVGKFYTYYSNWKLRKDNKKRANK